MKPIENAWNGLVQRKLLPLAILLLAAIVAIPFLLAKDAEPLPAAPASLAAAAGSKSDPLSKPVVTVVDENAPAARRRVLGKVKDPFMPAPEPQWKKDADAAEAAGGETTTSDTTASTGSTAAGSGSGGSGGSVAGAGATSPSTGTAPAAKPAEPVATTTPEPTAKSPVSEQSHKVYSAVVKFGKAGEDAGEAKTLARLKPLPDASAPAVLYFGVGPDEDGGKAAYFYLADGAELEDETQCRPSVRDCQGIILAAGKKAKVNVVDEATGATTTYELEVVKIKSKVVSDADKAAESRAKVSKAGRRVLRAHTSAFGPLRYRYESKSGLVRKLDKRSYRALLAKSARIALGTAGGF